MSLHVGTYMLFGGISVLRHGQLSRFRPRGKLEDLRSTTSLALCGMDRVLGLPQIKRFLQQKPRSQFETGMSERFQSGYMKWCKA